MRVPSPGDEFGRYRLDRVLGQGGMGIVFAATDPRLDRTVAIKVITGGLATSAEFRARFQAEAATLARLDSPHVISIYDHDEVDETPYIVTQYVDGSDLWGHLRENGPMPAREALSLCAQLARGLADAHRAGVIHRDVKPGNVLLRDAGTPDQHAYLCDFGIARADGVQSAAPTATGMVAGTWSYLAPERASGADATPASDIYALGCVLWTCLTGREPYPGSDAQALLAHQQAPIPQLSGDTDFVTRLNALIERLLAKSPDDRYDDASEVRRDLEALAAHAPATTVEGAARPDPHEAATVVRGPAAAGAAGHTTSPRRGLLIGVLALVLALVAAGVVWLVVSSDDDENEPAPKAADIVTGDRNGDGYGDLTLMQARNNGTSELATWTVPSNGKSFGSPTKGDITDGVLMLGDVDGDGKTDEIWGSGSVLDTTEVTLTVRPGDDSDEWSTTLPVDGPTDLSFFSTVVLDLDGDGRDDLAVYQVDNESGQASVWAIRAADKSFTAPEQWYVGDAGYGSSAVAGDFDGDGRDELLEVLRTFDGSEHTLRILTPASDSADLEPGPSTTIDGRTLPLSTFLAADIDGDGADEVVIAGAAILRILAADVTGGTVAKAKPVWRSPKDENLDEFREELYSNIGAPWLVADLDDDGDDDLVHVASVDPDQAGSTSDFDLTAYVADEGKYSDPRLWGRLPCGSECGDTYRLITPAP